MQQPPNPYPQYPQFQQQPQQQPNYPQTQTYYPPQQQWQQPAQHFTPQPPLPQYQLPLTPAPQMNNVVVVNINKSNPSFLVRVLWYIFIGCWLGFFWLNIGYFFCFTVIGLPLGLIMLNRLPWVLTLRP